MPSPSTTLGSDYAALNSKPINDQLPINDPQSSLPTELVQEVFSYLSPSDYDSARLVCRFWYQVSLCKPLFHNLLSVMKFDPSNNGCPCFGKPTFYTPQPSCPDTCPCKYQFPVEPISTWDLKSLRMAFSIALEKWPSKVRVSCGKLVVDMSSFLKNYDADWGYSDPQREVESLCFSEKSGSFVCTITKEADKCGGVARKLWIHRLFTSKHSPFNNFARPNDGFLFFIEGSRCLPGQLYMTMELTKYPGIPVVGVRVQEHSVFSAVRRIVVTYINNKEEEITFNKFKPDKQGPVNNPNHDMVFYDRKGVTYKSRPTRPQNRREGPTPYPKSWASNLLSKKDQFFRKDIVVHTAYPKRSSLITTSHRLLATIGDNDSHQMCSRITIPLSSSKEAYCSIIITPQNDIFVCAPSPNLSGSAAPNAETVHARYKFSIPARASETSRPRITHLTVAPQYFYDFGRGYWWMAVCAAYDNGEVWLWRADMEVFGDYVSRTLLMPCSSQTTRQPLDGPPLHPKTISHTCSAISCQIYKTTRQTHVGCCVPHPRPGDFDAELGECVSVNLQSFSSQTLGDHGSPSMKTLNVLIPSPEKGDDGFVYVRAWKLGYMPGLKALDFVGRGKTVLAGTKNEVVVWDMRLWNGFERGKLKAEF